MFSEKTLWVFEIMQVMFANMQDIYPLTPV